MSATPGWLEALLQRLAADAPAALLLVAPDGHPLLATLRKRLADTALDIASAAELPARRYPVALVAATLETSSPDAARELLAALRDRLAERVVVWVDTADSPLREDDLRALAYRVHARDGSHVLCGFDLYDYKDQPDWLNARHWAHPGLWDKFRW